MFQLIDGNPETMVIAFGVSDKVKRRPFQDSVGLIMPDKSIGDLLALGLPFVLRVRPDQEDRIQFVGFEIQAIGLEVITLALQLFTHEYRGAKLRIVLAAVSYGRSVDRVEG